MAEVDDIKDVWNNINCFLHEECHLPFFDYPAIETVAVLFLKQKLFFKSVLVVCVYIAPCNVSMRLALLTDLLDYLVQQFRGSLIYVVGDFNMPDINWMKGEDQG